MSYEEEDRTFMPGYASWVYCILGNAYLSQGGYAKAIEYYTQDLAIAKEVGDRAGEVGSYGSLGNAYESQGGYAKAIEYYTQFLAIAEEVGDRAGKGKAYANLGNAYRSQGDFAKAIEYHTHPRPPAATSHPLPHSGSSSISLGPARSLSGHVCVRAHA